MKSSNTPVICTLICLVPTILAGQAPQVQNQTTSLPQIKSHLSAPSRQMTDPPLLRLKNTGPMGEDGVQLELTSLTLTPGPSIFLDCPEPMMPGTGAIRLQPSDLSTHLRISQLDDPGFDLLQIDMGDVIVPPYRPQLILRKPKIAGTQSAILLKPSEDTPYLSLTNFGSMGQSGLRMNVANLPTVPSFFDVFYDLNLAVTGVGFGFDPDDLCLSHEFDLDPPRLLTKIQSSNPLYLNSFFDITYDLSLGSLRTEHKNLAFTITASEPSTICWRFDSSLPELPDFFDICYDLDIGSVIMEHNNWKHVMQYNETDWNFITSLSSNDPGITGFFDITYDISEANTLKQWTRSGGTGFPPLEMRYEYDALGRRIKQVNTDYQDGSFFDITYDFPLQRLKTECNNLICTGIFSDGTKHEITYTSNEPSIPSFFDITYDIGLMSLQKHVIKAGAPGILPLELRYEYDGLNRRVREVCVDNQNGSSLTIERRLVPGAVVLDVGGNLEIEGTLSANPGPVTIPDNVIINGDLQVNGMFASFNKFFKIDHPLDPDNKYLIHSCVESPDMMNIYNGNIITDDHGFSTIQLPDYFEALNTEFRYQLTCIGQFAQAIIAEKISGNQFVISTDKPNVEVSWQVTGIRHDPGAQQSKFAVEAEKEPEMKGKRMYVLQY